MRYWIAFLFVVGTLIVTYAHRSECAWCPTYPCFGHGQCGKCVCIKAGVDPAGFCASID